MTAKIKKGDNVVVLSGKDKGKNGKVLKIIKSKTDFRIKAIVEGVNVVAHLAHGVVMLGPHGGQGALVLDVGLLQLHLQLGQLSLPLLVQLNLGAGVGPRLL